MTAPYGLSPDRLRIGQPVVASADHTALTPHGTPLLSLSGDVGTIAYFWSDGRFVVEWNRHPGSFCHYGPEAWPSKVGPVPVVKDTDPAPSTARSGDWLEAVSKAFR